MKLKKGYILYLLILSSIVSLTWIVFNVFQTTVTSTISQKVSTEIIPIKPDFDQKTIDSLKKREKATAQYDVSTVSEIQNQPVASPTARPILTLTPTPTKNLNPTATEEASIKL